MPSKIVVLGETPWLMNKLYFLVPLVGVLAFGGFYWPYLRQHEAHLVEQRRVADLAQNEATRVRLAAQAEAVRQANLVLEQRRQERALQAQLEDSRQKARVDAELRRSAAFDREKSLRSQLSRLRGDLESRQAIVARAENQKLELEREQRFLEAHVRDVVADRDPYVRLLESLETAEARVSPSNSPKGASLSP